MKTKVLLFFALIAFASCNSNSNSEQWRMDNQAAYDAIKNNNEWKELDTNDGPSGVYYRDLTASETEIGNEYPIETALVMVNYTGKYYNDNVFDNGKKVTFIVNRVVRGFGAALQHMRTGQTWEICIPYYLGYGFDGNYDSYTGQITIPGYTTLFFEIELLKIEQYPK